MAAVSAPFLRWRRSLRGAAGIARSLRIYYWSHNRRRRMVNLYEKFVRAGDLVFDIGSHVGDRISAFRSLGARVVAVEPQPAALTWLRWRYGRDAQVQIVQAAASDTPGSLTLHVNLANPTVSTASSDFIESTRGARGWDGQFWDDTITVPAVTIDELIARHGEPAFMKIDVEGFELNVLNGLSRPISALSFEFTAVQPDIALRCLDRLSKLGPYGFNVAVGESQQLESDALLDAARMSDYIRNLRPEVTSGDIYAVLERDRKR
jgi:FkbM family methyltransferase